MLSASAFGSARQLIIPDMTKTSIDVKVIFDSARSSASLGDKVLFKFANILQKADVVLQVVF